MKSKRNTPKARAHRPAERRSPHGQALIRRARSSAGTRHSHGEPRRGPAQADTSENEPRVTQPGSRSADDVIEGRKPVMEALRSGRPINKILVAQDVRRHGTIAEILHLARQSGLPVEHVDGRAIQRLSLTGRTQGVLALAAAKGYIGLDDIFEQTHRRGEEAFYMLLDGIEDPQNLGAVLRTADATGVHGVVIPTRRAVGLTGAVARASAGAVEYVRVARASNLAQVVQRLVKLGVWTVGVDPVGTNEYTQVDYRGPVAIVVGSEGRGISRLVRERCDVLTSIPMVGHLSSLNASVAAALVMYEARRQRRLE